jgi:hypothetical protein
MATYLQVHVPTPCAYEVEPPGSKSGVRPRECSTALSLSFFRQIG